MTYLAKHDNVVQQCRLADAVATQQNLRSLLYVGVRKRLDKLLWRRLFSSSCIVTIVRLRSLIGSGTEPCQLHTLTFQKDLRTVHRKRGQTIAQGLHSDLRDYCQESLRRITLPHVVKASKDVATAICLRKIEARCAVLRHEYTYSTQIVAESSFELSEALASTASTNFMHFLTDESQDQLPRLSPVTWQDSR